MYTTWQNFSKRQAKDLQTHYWVERVLINYIDTKAKCRQLKKLTGKVTLPQVFIRVYRLELQSVVLVFSTGFVNYCPSPLFFASALPPSKKSYLSQEYSFSAWRSLWQKIALWASYRTFCCWTFPPLTSNAIKLGCQGWQKNGILEKTLRKLYSFSYLFNSSIIQLQMALWTYIFLY